MNTDLILILILLVVLIYYNQDKIKNIKTSESFDNVIDIFSKQITPFDSSKKFKLVNKLLPGLFLSIEDGSELKLNPTGTELTISDNKLKSGDKFICINPSTKRIKLTSNPSSSDKFLYMYNDIVYYTNDNKQITKTSYNPQSFNLIFLSSEITDPTTIFFSFDYDNNRPITFEKK